MMMQQNAQTTVGFWSSHEQPFPNSVREGLPTTRPESLRLANTAPIVVRQDGLFYSEFLKPLINCHSEAPTPGDRRPGETFT